VRTRVRGEAVVFFAAVALMSIGLSGAAQIPGPVATASASAPATGARTWTMPRTAEGHSDLQGIWDYRSATPLERPPQFAGREFMTAEEAAEYERRAAAREDGRPPDDPRTEPSVHPAWWLDYGKRVVKTMRTSLIVDPSDGRIPPLTAGAQQRIAARRVEAKTHGPADSYENRSLFERCLTRGVPDGMLPGPYNNNLQILQAPGYVVLFTEMIHDARIVAIDDRPHTSANVRKWLGDSRGQWEGDTLVVETTNFTNQSSFNGSDDRMRLTERFTRTGDKTLRYQFTIDDPSAFTAPWTVEVPMNKNSLPIYEYACHEGNYGMFGILSGARAVEKDEKAAADAAKKGSN
jgi:hypothetical protein